MIASSYHLYADDLQIYLHSSPSELPQSLHKINYDLQLINNWIIIMTFFNNAYKLDNIYTRIEKSHVKLSALQVEELLEKGQLPLIVGGTNYYIESLLWKVLVAEEVTKGAKDEVSSDEEQQTATDDQSNEELHKRLAEVDPQMAKTLHPNNRRKVVR
ncbi:hypothetical protein J437_LFUL011678 [Ladona fulva]|uniref:Uncharacterized protein n=1 Tax=Ladona fulva TaxID=123851 RepID=A0A8K0KFH3_LADFU|nr:hypothetical protein J437_LFUL011678 [Ladona fulva]